MPSVAALRPLLRCDASCFERRLASLQTTSVALCMRCYRIRQMLRCNTNRDVLG